MKKKQDRQGVRTAVDLERKYQFNKQFESFSGFAKKTREDLDEAERSTSNLAQHTERTYTPRSEFLSLEKTVGDVVKEYATLAQNHSAVAEELSNVKNSLGNYTPKTLYDKLVETVSGVKASLVDYVKKTDYNRISAEVSKLMNRPTYTDGESDGWYYRKWSDGRAECWKILTHSTTISTEWGALYQGTATTRQTYPFPFIDKPVEHVTLTAGSYQAILFPEKGGNGVNGAYASACYNLCRPSSVTTSSEFYLNFYVVGKWK